MTRFLAAPPLVLLASCQPAAAAMSRPDATLFEPLLAVIFILMAVGFGTYAWRVRDILLRTVAVIVMLTVLLLGAGPALAADVAPAGPTPVLLPWGDVIVAAVNTVVVPILGTLIGLLAVWIAGQAVRLVPWLQRFVTAQLVERMLTNVLDFGVNAVTDAAKGRTLSVSTGRVVLDIALRRAIAQATPAIVAAAGGPEELAAKLFRKMDLEPEATTANVLTPVVQGLRAGR